MISSDIGAPPKNCNIFQSGQIFNEINNQKLLFITIKYQSALSPGAHSPWLLLDDGYRDRNILLPHGKMLLKRIVDVKVWWIAEIACLSIKGFTQRSSLF